LRSLSMRVGVLDKVDTMRHRDDGPLVRHLLAFPSAPAPLAFAALAAAASLILVVSELFGSSSEAATGAVALVLLGAGIPAKARHDGPLDWLVPAALRAAEYLFVVAVGWAGSVPTPVIFLLLFTLALRHYDLTARMEKGAPAGRGTLALFGWDVRVAVLAVLGLAGHATVAVAGLALIVGGSFLWHAVADWRRS